MEPIRWGILATGWIADKMAEALTEVSGAETLAVGSRTQAAADEFGQRWNIPRRYDSYEALAGDADLDVIYIATPHSHHYQNMRLCLEAGKHVLCEKPLTLNAHQAATCIDLARQRGLFLMEAMWMRYIPAIEQVRQWVEAEVIGRVRLIQADFCFNVPFDPEHRADNPALGGGALLDLGIYPLSFSTMLLGLPQKAEGAAALSPTGVDELDTITLHYDNGILAQLMCSTRVERPQSAFVIGTKGYIKVHPLMNRPDRV
ncbi:MAG: Gfo/Idh/MocA family oxidoreductase, partial [Candidatus Promineifilaceae bacterium]|nr:Gfo/Idh/MocA family oxidoreductase [Candidatus Promineifilaceae bacterium]